MPKFVIGAQYHMSLKQIRNQMQLSGAHAAMLFAQTKILRNFCLFAFVVFARGLLKKFCKSTNTFATMNICTWYAVLYLYSHISKKLSKIVVIGVPRGGGGGQGARAPQIEIPPMLKNYDNIT